MKFFSKVAAILAALMLACAFVACSNDGGSSDDGTSTNSTTSISSSATLIATYTGNGMTFRFYSSNQVSMSGQGASGIGTYTGNPTSGSGVISYDDSGAGQHFDDSYSVSGTTMTITGGFAGSYTKQ